MAEAPTQKMIQVCIPKDAVMNGFCYSYCKALVLKVHQLIADDEWAGELMRMIMLQLDNQINGLDLTENSMDYHEIVRWLELTEQFLAIFEEERKLS